MQRVTGASVPVCLTVPLKPLMQRVTTGRLLKPARLALSQAAYAAGHIMNDISFGFFDSQAAYAAGHAGLTRKLDRFISQAAYAAGHLLLRPWGSVHYSQAAYAAGHH